MNLLPRSFATLALAVSAVPGVAPLAAHLPSQQNHPAAHHTVDHPNVHAMPHALVRPAGLPVTKQPGPAVPATGGWTEQNPASPAVLAAATFAVVDLSREFGGHYVVEAVTRAQTQVVEGTNFRLELRIARVQNYILGTRKDCTVVVWSRPWLKPADGVTSADCQSVDAAVPAEPAALHEVVVADAKVAPKMDIAHVAGKIDAKHACLVVKNGKVIKVEKAVKVEELVKTPVQG
jgi:hypothetical protein